MPKLLTIEQKQLRLEIAQDMLETVNSDPNFFNTVITGDETTVIRHFVKNENPTALTYTSSLIGGLSATDSFCRRENIHAYGLGSPTYMHQTTPP